jgi:hypothetical protein
VPGFLSPCTSDSPEEKNHLEIRCPEGGEETPLIEFPVDPDVWPSAEKEAGVLPSGGPCRTDAELVLLKLSLVERTFRPFPVGGGELYLTFAAGNGGLWCPLIRTLCSLVGARLCAVGVTARGGGGGGGCRYSFGRRFSECVACTALWDGLSSREKAPVATRHMTISLNICKYIGAQ